MSQVTSLRASIQQVFHSSSSSQDPSLLVRLPVDIIKRVIIAYLSDYSRNGLMNRVSEVACLNRTCKSIYILGLVLFTENLNAPNNMLLQEKLEKYTHLQRLRVDDRYIVMPYNIGSAIEFLLSKSCLFPSLQKLTLWGTPVLDVDLSALRFISNLLFLDIKSQFITGSGFSVFSDCPHLSEVHFHQVTYVQGSREFITDVYLDGELGFWEHLSKIHTLGLASFALEKDLAFLEKFACRKLVITISEKDLEIKYSTIETNYWGTLKETPISDMEISFHGGSGYSEYPVLGYDVAYKLPYNLVSLKISALQTVFGFFDNLNIRILDLSAVELMTNRNLCQILPHESTKSSKHLEKIYLFGVEFSRNNLKEFATAFGNMSLRESIWESEILSGFRPDPSFFTSPREADRLIMAHMDGGILEKQRHSALIRSDAEIKAHKRQAGEAAPEGIEPPVKKFKPLIAASTTLKSTEE